MSGANTREFGVNTREFGANTREFGANTREFGVNTREFGVNTREFGANTREFGVNTREFGVNTREFGANTREFGVNTREFGVNTREFGMMAPFMTTWSSILSGLPAWFLIKKKYWNVYFRQTVTQPSQYGRWTAFINCYMSPLMRQNSVRWHVRKSGEPLRLLSPSFKHVLHI
ncbi:hypothetical protein SB775_20195 [Peribacillus sp. SIMBA_075]|uniref:hypothetical protein n=1 Tax=Peribacillus sp. SIMBA_075 TaxID=3085813 RepID=UPI00397DEB58